jgi:hypothetical protein
MLPFLAMRNVRYDSPMTEPGSIASDLPRLDRTDDPRGGSAAWTILIVAAVLIAGVVALMMWLW